jgi:hypothetical protein
MDQDKKKEFKVCGNCQAWDGWTDHEGHWCYCKETKKIHHCADPACNLYIKQFKAES